VDVAAGNPRLLEWLHGVLQERSLPVSALLDKLEQEETRFREDVLIDKLVGTLQRSEKHTLACAALYRLPVALAAIEALTADPQTAQHLQTAAKVGLVEIIPTTEGTRYFVSNLLDSALADELSETERQPLAAKASQYLFAQEENAETLVLKSEALALETVRLSVLGKEQYIAIEMSDKLYPIMLNQYRYQEVEAMCQLVLTLGDEFRILSALASTEQCLGRSEAAQHFERALQIIPKIETSTHHNTLWEIASAYLYQVNFLQRRGDLEVAMMFLQDYVLPIYEKLGDTKSKAMTLGRIADILEESEQFEEALHLYETEVLPIYKADQDVLSIAMTKSKIADILQTQGQLDEALQIRLIEVLPNFEKRNDPRLIAVEKGKIAEILQAYGQFDESLDIRENHELPVYEKLGDVRELLIGRTNLAILLWQMDAAANATRVQELLCLALTAARRLRIPEAEIIEEWLVHMDLSCDQ
jgi:tetratricopeptide (TPR) repeat protein